MGSPQLVVGLDWGGTWVRAALVDRGGAFVWQSRRPNPQRATKEEYLNAAQDLLAEAIGQSAGPVAGIGVAVAGPVEPEQGTLYQPPNLMVLDGVALKPLWEAEFSVPVWVGNDANLAAMGEYHFGAGKEAADQGRPVKTLFYVTVSTGIGGGVVHEGAVFLGANGLTAEIGHINIYPDEDAPACQCGARGCLESIASGTSIARTARELLAIDSSGASLLRAVVPGPITSEDVFDAAAKGDGLANAVLDRAVAALSNGLTDAVHLFNPDMVVLGGGVTVGLVKLGLMDRILQGIRGRAMSELHKEFRLESARLGDDVGIAGAAAMAWERIAAGAP